MRITRDQMLMMMAHVASERGTCRRLRVGALLAVESRPISIGYNGVKSGQPHCGPHCDMNRPCLITVHAERNAINWARAFGTDVRGSTLYITDSPCDECSSLILEAGIARLVYDRQYRNSDPLKHLGTKIEVDQCHITPALIASFVDSLTTPE